MKFGLQGKKNNEAFFLSFFCGDYSNIANFRTETPMTFTVIYVILAISYVLLNPLNPELNPICCLLALLGAHHFLHVSRIRVKLLTFTLLMSYIYIWSTHS